MTWTNVCYYEMVNCDTYCNAIMRLKCRIRVFLWKIFKGYRPEPRKDGE